MLGYPVSCVVIYSCAKWVFSATKSEEGELIDGLLVVGIMREVAFQLRSKKGVGKRSVIGGGGQRAPGS